MCLSFKIQSSKQGPPSYIFIATFTVNIYEINRQISTSTPLNWKKAVKYCITETTSVAAAHSGTKRDITPVIASCGNSEVISDRATRGQLI